MRNILLLIIITTSAYAESPPKMRKDFIRDCTQSIQNSIEMKELESYILSTSGNPYIDRKGFEILSQKLKGFGVDNRVDDNHGEGWGSYGPAVIIISTEGDHHLNRLAKYALINHETKIVWSPRWNSSAEACFESVSNKTYDPSEVIATHRHIHLRTFSFIDALKSPYLSTPIVRHEAVHMKSSVKREQRKPCLFHGKVMNSDMISYKIYMSLEEVPAYTETLLAYLDLPLNKNHTNIFLSSIAILIRSSTLLEVFYKEKIEFIEKFGVTTAGIKYNKSGIWLDRSPFDKLRVSEILSFDPVKKENLKSKVKEELMKRVMFYQDLKKFFKKYEKAEFVKLELSLKWNEVDTSREGVYDDYVLLHHVIKKDAHLLRSLVKSVYDSSSLSAF
ncbi:MAG: hypothetical protein KA715_08875 [Xanthomonadaceae bacterium]|nr:hypothetical protein [Xanthomonadaceae bacterium]